MWCEHRSLSPRLLVWSPTDSLENLMIGKCTKNYLKNTDEKHEVFLPNRLFLVGWVFLFFLILKIFLSFHNLKDTHAFFKISNMYWLLKNDKYRWKFCVWFSDESAPETDESAPPICHIISILSLVELDGIMHVFIDDTVSLGMNN